jgi:hypothetical protein
LSETNPLPTISTREALEDLAGTVCKACDGRKASRKSHCRGCYMKLPPRLKSALYRPVGAGYEEAYTESLATLRARGGRS